MVIGSRKKMICLNQAIIATWRARNDAKFNGGRLNPYVTLHGVVALAWTIKRLLHLRDLVEGMKTNHAWLNGDCLRNHGTV